MCNCEKTTMPTVIVDANGKLYDKNPCTNTSIPVLQIYQTQIKCVVDKGSFETAKCTEAECLSALNILGYWIAAKLEDPFTCEYVEYLVVMQDLVKRIILNKAC